MNERINILIAEDDVNLGKLLVDYLENEGFKVKLFKDGESAWSGFNNHGFHLCLLDVMLPKMDGFTLAKKIRGKNEKIPLLFITAKSFKTDKLLGYEIGADDYITKPFDEEELLWKIKALVKRMKASSSITDILLLGNYKFYPATQLLELKGENRRITEKETQILKYLYDHKNQLIRREEMLKNVWGENDYFLGRSLDVFITKMRKYLSGDTSVSIENVFGVGFILHVPV